MNPRKMFDTKEKGLKIVLTEPEPKPQIRTTKIQRLEPRPPLSAKDAVLGSCCMSSVKRFDVFINHRGPDTKQTMAIHMYDLLRDRGVATFLDKEELQGGDSLSEVIEEAIECSKVQVCIFSSGYAASVWCLMELEMIMEKYEMGKCVVIPIFYDVSPSDVRRLKGVFGQGFEKHSRRHGSQVMEGWRKALCKVSNISGYEGKGELCMTVVNRVCQHLEVGMVATPGKVVGIKDLLSSVKHEIMRCHNEAYSVTLVQISGIGGIGKTTFARSLYNDIYSQFERHCFVEDVNGVVEKNGVNAVQRQLLNKLLRYDPNVSGSEGKQLLKQRLQNADILVVLDNISRENCLSVVFIDDYVCLGASSIIIVTSRESGVLQQDMKIAKSCKNLISLQITNLPFQESREIFCHYAFEETQVVSTQFNDLINKIVNKCDGIPLALALLGRHLYGRDIVFWKNFWVTIRDSLPPNLKKIIRFSYDNLEIELEKRLFLDVAIFFRLESVDLLKKCSGKDDVDEAKISVALDNLQRKLLIDVQDGILCMHDLLVDLGKTIVEDESSDPGHRSRLWNPSDIREVLSDNMGTDKIKGLSLIWKGAAILDEDENGEPCPWSADAFAEMSSLEFLILDGYCIQGDFSKLSKRLLFLKWAHFPLESIPTTLCIKRARVILLSNGLNRGVWEHSPKDAPVNLRALILHECSKIQRIPEFSARFRQLSSIALNSLVSLQTIPDTFGLLQGLKHLSLVECITLKILPETIGDLKNLHELYVHDCSQLKSLPLSLGQLQQLECLNLKFCRGLEQLPETFGDLQNLRLCLIHGCSRLGSLPESFKHLPQIESVKIVECCNLGISENCFAEMNTLQKLDIWSCCSKCKVPKLPCLNQQNRLKSVSVRNVCDGDLHHARARLASPLLSGVEELPDNMENLRQLHYLELKDHALMQLPESMGNLSLLRSLRLTELWNLQELPESIGNLSGLQYLYIKVCWSLQQLPQSIGSLQQLKYLHICGCWNLQQLPPSLGNLQNLSRLEIVDCPVLKGLPCTLGNLSNMVWLTVKNCAAIEVIHVQAMHRLSHLKVVACDNLRTIAGIGGCIDFLAILEIRGCDQFSFEDCSVLGSQRQRKFEAICLSLNQEFLTRYDYNDFANLTGLMEKLEKNSLPSQIILNAKVSPCFFPRLRQRLTSVLSRTDNRSLLVHQLSAHDNRLTLVNNPFGKGFFASITCFISAAYTESYADDLSPPTSKFRRSIQGIYGTTFSQFGFGEEIHFEMHSISVLPTAQTGDFMDIVAEEERGYPLYQAFAQEGWVICAGQAEMEIPMLLDVCRTFYLELQRQHLLSDAWSKLPCELNLFSFSALDIANCKITKICRYCNTCVMEEETDLTLKRRRSLFADDYALELLQKRRKFNFVATNVFECDFETTANLYEMLISITHKGKVGYTRKLQRNVSRSSKGNEIPQLLQTLLQNRAFDLKSRGVKDRKVELCTTLAQKPRWYQIVI